METLKKIGTLSLISLILGLLMTICLLSFGGGENWSWSNFSKVFPIVFLLFFCAKGLWLDDDVDGFNFTTSWPPIAKTINTVIGMVVGSALLTAGWLLILVLITLPTNFMMSNIAFLILTAAIFFGQLTMFLWQHFSKTENSEEAAA